MTKNILIDVMIYAVFLIVFYFAGLVTEYADLICPDGFFQKDKSLCTEGNGKWYQKAIASKEHSTSEIIDAVDAGSDSITNYIFWRRYFILSFFIVITTYLIVFRRFPPGHEFILCFFIAFVFMYFGHNFYNCHYHNHVRDHIKTNTKKLRELINVNGTTQNITPVEIIKEKKTSDDITQLKLPEDVTIFQEK